MMRSIFDNYPEKFENDRYIKVREDFDTLGCWYKDTKATDINTELVLIYCADGDINRSKHMDTKPYNYFDEDYIKCPLASGANYFYIPYIEGHSYFQQPGFTVKEAKELVFLFNKFLKDPDCDIEGRYGDIKPPFYHHYANNVRRSAHKKAWKTIVARKYMNEVINEP